MSGKYKSILLIAFVVIIMLASIVIVNSRRTADRVTAFVSSETPSLWYSPLELDFGPLGIGVTSLVQVVQITNIGMVTLNFDGGVPEDDNFSATHTCAGGLAPGESCQYLFQFVPQSRGQLSTTAGPSSEAGKIDVVLRGTGVGPDFTYNARSLDLGKVVIGESGSPQTVRIKNTGMAPLIFNDGEAPPPFSADQNCTPSLAPGETCEYLYSFSPTSSGIFTATTGPASNAGKQMRVVLKGEGISSLDQYSGFYVSPLEIDFGPVGVDLTSDTQVVTIINQSSTTLKDFAGGGVSLPFSGAQNCPGELPPFGECQYLFDFSPSESGVFSTTSNTSTNLGPFSITMHGTGLGASLSVSPLSIDFGPVPPGITSEPQVVTITNTGPTLLVDFIGGGVEAPFSGHQNCSGGVPPGGSCQYTFFFTPEELGRFTATSDSSSNGGTFSIQLAGGVGAPQIAKGFSPPAIAPRGISTLELSVSNPNPTVALTEVAISDSLPSGMRVASPAETSVSAECGTPVFSPGGGEDMLSFSDGTIPGGRTCLIRLGVTADVRGSYTNTTAPVSSGNAGSGNSASATLYVGFRLFMPAVFR